MLIIPYCMSLHTTRGGVAQWVAHLTHNVEVIGSSSTKGPRCFLEKKLYPYCLVLAGSRNGFKLDITIKSKIDLNVK